MLIKEPNSTTEESYRDSEGIEGGYKFKNIFEIAKRKFKSKSQVPVCMNSESSIENEREAEVGRLGQYQGIPVDLQHNS